MEMCYGGALVMPREFEVIDEEEMTYIDGGWYLEKYWWGYNLYLTHEERRLVTQGQGIVGFSTLCPVAIAAVLYTQTTMWNYDDGYGVKMRILGSVCPYFGGIWALNSDQEKKLAKKNKVVVKSVLPKLF